MPEWLKPEDENIWQEAKKIAEQQNKGSNYGFIVNVFKKIKRNQSIKESNEIQANAINNEILELAKQYINEKDASNKKLLIRSLSSLLREINKIGQLDFGIFINPEFSEFLTRGKELSIEESFDRKLPEQIVLKEGIISNNNTIDDIFELSTKYPRLSDDLEINGNIVRKLSSNSVDVGLYDLCLVLKKEYVPVKDKIINELKEKEKIDYVDDVSKIDGIFEKENQFIVDKHYNTPKVFVYKNKDSIKILTDFDSDVTNLFDKETISELRQGPTNYMIECNVSFMKGKQASTQEEILYDVVYPKQIDYKTATQVVLNAVDCFNYDKDISDLDYSERKKALKNFKYGHHFKLAPFMFANGKEQIPQATKIASKLMWSTGAKITSVDEKNNKTIVYLSKNE